MTNAENLNAYAAKLASFDEDGGDALIGVRGRYPHAANLTQRDKNHARIDAAEWGIRPNQPDVDCTDLFNQAMQDVGCGTISVTPGEYAISTLKLCSFVHLECNGARFMKLGTAEDSRAVSATGDEGFSSRLVESVNRGTQTIKVVDGSLFRPRTWVLVRDGDYIHKLNGRNQEIAYIKTVSANELTLNVRLHRGYTTSAAAEVVNITPLIGASMSGAEIVLQRKDLPILNGGGFHIDLAMGCEFYRNTVRNANSKAAFHLSRSTLVTVSGNEVRDGQNAKRGGWYGHGILVDEGSSEIMVLHNRFININQNAFQNNAGYSTFAYNIVQGAADTGVNTHGSGSSHVDIIGNRIEACNQGIAISFSGNTAADDNVTIVGNRVLNSGVNGISVMNSDARKSHGISIQGNRVAGFGFTTSGIGISVARVVGAVVDNNHVTNDCIDVTTDSLIRFEGVNDGAIRNNTVRDAVKGVGIRWRGCKDLHIAGNSIARATVPVDSKGNSGCRLENNMIDVRVPGEADAGTLVVRNSWQAESIAGSVKLDFVSSNFASVHVTFPPGSFPITPIVIVTAEDTGQPLSAQYSKATKDGFTVSVRVANGSAVTQSLIVNWSAVPAG
ncbi:hypothetical protein BLX41_25535 [Pseudomonas protegens]|uniref:right-handed parallel beta-helix repeat-containing protein n=1 Tax=Pseudomonas protegens TaxID=380021 RepID=UPI000F4C3F8E|nr:right-handed parallel beta-helix repeat-containing protein [Pseudomonas protegens]ROL65710.1 hypothetical protein BLX41_25535 [Pseudomonas protegens]